VDEKISMERAFDARFKRLIFNIPKNKTSRRESAGCDRYTVLR
jgi:hypothetical protein